MKKLLLLVTICSLSAGQGPGLSNTSANCYMNSVLQCLFSINPLGHFLQNHPDAFQQGSLGEAYRLLWEESRRSSATSISPAPILSCGIGNGQLGRQQDAEEFFSRFINTIVQEVTPAQHDFLYRMFFNDFGTYLDSKTYTLADGSPWRTQVQRVPMLTLPLTPVYGARLERLLSNLTSPEQVSYRFPDGSDGMATKKNALLYVAPVVIIQLKRFEPSGGNLVKNRVAIGIPLTLNMNDYVAPEERKDEFALYDLIGVVAHKGEINNGHYKAYAMTDQGLWYEYDDTQVSPLNHQALETRLADVNYTPYILFYERHGLTGPQPVERTQAPSPAASSSPRAPAAAPAVVAPPVPVTSPASLQPESQAAAVAEGGLRTSSMTPAQLAKARAAARKR